MSEDEEYASAIRVGQRTLYAQDLMANHCSHGRVQLHGSSSMVGQMVGLPIGLVEVRCAHAPAPQSMQMDGLALAVEFYRSNCVGCPHRDPNGVFPTLAMESDKWAVREGRGRASAEQEHAGRVVGWERRRAQRRAAVSAQGYAARDIAVALDTLDPHPDSAPDVDREMYSAAERQLREAGRRAPELFDAALVTALFADALATGSPAVVGVLGQLAAHGRASAVEVASTAVKLMISSPSPDAGRVIATLVREVEHERLVAALPNAVRLATPKDMVMTTLPGHPEALMAAASVVPEDVRRAIVEMVTDGDAADRAAGAHAAGLLLAESAAAHLPVLGRVLVQAVRGRGMAYAGEPDPNSECREALATAWRQLPSETRAVVEQYAPVDDQETADSLYGILRLVRVRDEPVEDEDARLVSAAQSLTEFRAARLSGDWGVSVALSAARDLRKTARKNVSKVAVHSRAALNALLNVISADVAALQSTDPSAEASMLTQMQAMSDAVMRGYLRSALGELLGVLAGRDDDALVEVVALLHADSADEERDSRMAEAMLDALTEAVTSSNLTVVLPELYSALLSTNVRVRSAAVGLWEACAKVTGTVPEPLADLAEALLTDRYTAVHRPMLDRLPRLGLADEKAAQLVNTCANWVVTYEQTGEDGVLEDALTAMLWAARRAGNEVEAECAAFALEHLSGLRDFDREQMLLSQLNEKADTPAWGRAAVSLLADPARADMFDRPDDRLATVLFQHPAGFGATSLEEFRKAVMNYLPELPWGTTRVLALLQGTGRYEDAAALADDAVAAMPVTDEFAPRRAYLETVAGYVHAEVDALNGDLPAATDRTMDDADDDTAAAPVVQHAVARRAVREALGLKFPHPSPDAAAVALTDARGSVSTVDVSSDVNLWMRMVGVAALLLRWDAATRRADPPETTNGLLAAARRQAQVAAADAKHASPIIRQWLNDVADYGPGAEVDDLLRRFARTPAPLAAHVPEHHPLPFTQEDTHTEIEQALTVVTVLAIDNAPVADLVILDRERSYRLRIDVRIEDWPDGAVECEVQLLSIFPKDRVMVPSATFTEADMHRDEFGGRLSTEGDLYCGLEQTPGQPGLDLPLLVVFRYSDATERRAELAGHTRFRMRPFDSTRDAETGFRQLDRPLHQVLDRVTDDSSLDPDDVAAFARFFTAVVRAAPSVTFDAAFRAGKKVTEADFHDRLESKLLADPALGGRVSRRDPIAGGFDDLMYDGIVAELKVEKTTPRSVEDCARYIGQPTQYGVGKGSRLSILVLLDHSRKQAPAGVPENYIGWVVPAMHGLTDPRYPSLVGVVIINTHWVLPSSWSRRTVNVIEQSPTPPPV